MLKGAMLFERSVRNELKENLNFMLWLLTDGGERDFYLFSISNLKYNNIP